NPETQRKKFDPELGYVNRWVPEFVGPEAAHAGPYPPPMVDLRESRQRALAAYECLNAP
ncbi:FAD-binding domain-containing protein, partial [Corynebacterium variabile]